MAYAGYLLKIGTYQIPHSILKADEYSPYVNMQDLDDYTDANGYLHREPVDLKVAKVEFETVPGLDNAKFSEFMQSIQAQYTMAKGRQFSFTCYIPEYDDYVTQTGYLADFQPKISLADGTKIIYDSFRMAIIGGVYNGG